MGIRDMIANGLETLLIRLAGKDKFEAAKMMATADLVRQQDAEGHVWADYLFLAACYGAAAGDMKIVQTAAQQIHEGFPNYDPSLRFSWDHVIPESMGAEDIVKETYPGKAMAWRVPAIGQMNKFCDAHKEFSFAETLGEYFAGAKKMAINRDEE